jgi:hypothetical protein
MKAKTPAEIDLLLRIIDQAFDHTSWHGPNLRGSVRGVDADEAAFRPAPGRKNIWEHIVHAAYWKYVVRRRLTGEKRGSFPLKGSNWFTRPSSPHLWVEDLALLDEMHRALRDVIAAFPAGKLFSSLGRGKIDAFRLISGIAAHDVYHAGQIGLLKRLARST